MSLQRVRRKARAAVRPAVLLALTAATACGGNLKVGGSLPEMELKSGTGSFEYDFGASPPLIAVRVEFKDSDGNPIGSMTGYNSGSMTTPEGTESVDWSIENLPEAAGQDVGITPGLSLGPRRQFGVHPREFGMGCLSIVYDPLDDQIAASVLVTADGLIEAQQIGQAVIQAGSSLPLPEGVEVGMFVTLDTDLSEVTLVSSLPQGFDSFVVTLDGAVIADLDARLNVTSFVNPAGWTMLTTSLPMTQATSSLDLSLVQRGAGDAEDSFITIEL